MIPLAASSVWRCHDIDPSVGSCAWRLCISGTLGSEVGAALTAALGVGTDGNFENLALLVVLCQLSSLLPLPFLGVLDGIDAPDDVDVEQDGGG